MKKVPVFILTGFLGSGKTTLLKRFLDECLQKKLTAAVLMNEMGETDTDGKSVSSKNQIIEKLLDGCICCNKKSEVTQSIEKLLTLEPDVIFIELTGVANPEEVADSLTEPELLHRVYLEKVITLIDAEHILSYNSMFESDRELVRTTRRQIEVADMQIVNKVDLVSEGIRSKINKLLVKYNPAATISYVNYSNIDVTKLFTFSNANRVTVKIKGTKQESNHHTNHHSHSRINSISLPLLSMTTKRDIETFLKKWKSNLLRAKGYVLLDDGTYLIQQVMKRLSWERTDYTGEHYLVLIGIDLQKEEILKDWQRVIQKTKAF
ncbi:CobW family GTP-binding protein [Desertibacillus haloalkaliphilus]|uniref:CobW family GTP-binding protein n=1 Tax=Desertibacillus haloalkaliphilus TaxID=1328930 RepID=UPI001C27843F|nr:GTP-binding protein [Desertibacillus haloalkaliphilus]MBU8905342.1 GTP-binding protein [Desertibacillus haloalkaliphilus]